MGNTPIQDHIDEMEHRNDAGIHWWMAGNRAPGVPSREEMYEILKERSIAIQSRGHDDG